MTIQRQYTLPHCNLILEGLSANATDPPLSHVGVDECGMPTAGGNRRHPNGRQRIF